MATLTAITEKRCNNCDEIKPLDEFNNQPRNKRNGKQAWCKACARISARASYRRDPQAAAERQKRWQARNPEKVARIKHGCRLRKRYGINVDDYDRMVAEQGDRCAICGSSDKGRNERWSVDHDHACCPGAKACGNCVRGLLCSSCNDGLGRFKDSIPALLAAARYLGGDL